MSGTGRGGGVRGPRDAAAQRAENAAAPRIPNLLGRIAELFRPHRAALVVTVLLVLLAAGLGVLPPLLTQQAFDRGLFPPEGRPDLPVLTELVALMLLTWLASAALGIGQTALTARIGNGVTGALRVRLFRHLQEMDLAFFTRTKTGVIQSRLQNDVGGVAGVLSTTVQSVIGNTVTVIAALVAMLLLSWQLTLVAVVLLPALVVVQRRVGQVRARIATRTQESLSEMTAITQEALSVSGVLLAKVFDRQEAEVRRYAGENERQVRLQVQQAMSGQWFFAVVSVILSAVPAVTYLVAAWLMTQSVPVTAGTVVAFTTVQARLMWPLMGLLRIALDLQTSQALFARIFEYLDLEPAIVDAPAARDVDPTRLGLVEFDAVGFRYPDQPAAARPILRDVSFRLEPGTFAAFVGSSGAGKSTIASLVPRLHDATEGRVLVAGVDVRELRRASLIGAIGVVSQETYLFHASIAENLRYAKPEATDGELEAAARAAHIHDTIAAFPDGYGTLVGERGYRLSGGEKQRVAIARVLLKDPAVLILDEATSALDSVSEGVVQAALDGAARGRTTLAIAHRLSTIASADVVFVVEEGRIVESGAPADRARAGGPYARLLAAQPHPLARSTAPDGPR